MDYQKVRTNGIDLHVVQDGPRAGRLAILLHGFPEFWYGWRRQIPYLAAAGFRVMAPDQRGYNLSDKPAGTAAYTLDELGSDVIGLMDAAGHQKVFVVGHDWGGAVAWWLAAVHPERLARMVIINCPHGAVFKKHLRRSFAQMRKSWYMLFFQLPYVPEALIRWKNGAMLVRTLKNSSRPGAFTIDDLTRYPQAWLQPRAATAMLNWYRAVMQRPPALPGNHRNPVPTLLIWGAQDRFLGRELARPSIDLCEDGQLVFYEDATHWVQHEKPEQVNELIHSFFRGKPTRG